MGTLPSDVDTIIGMFALLFSKLGKVELSNGESRAKGDVNDYTEPIRGG